MSRVDLDQLTSLQADTGQIRNFCILAHVDHGKTTLSDSLVSSNGIFSPRLAGKLRFLDSTEEEQKRGITMHSSAISLLYRLEKPGGGAPPPPPDQQQEQPQQPPPSQPAAEAAEEYLINLVDSPGHIDFSSDVSTATRLCDGALVLVDVLEGMCTQTHAVLYKALKERMRPCLVLNKIDRLALEMQLSPVEAFHHLRRIVENANALAYSLVVSELRSEEAEADAASTSASASTQATELDSPLLEEWTFAPEKGNVIFASALDCWGFGLAKFANLWSKKMGVNRAVLQKYLFEDYAFSAKTKKIVRCDPSDASSRPMFATMVLEPIWQLYSTAVTQADPEKAAKMAQRGMDVELPPREVNKREPRATLQAIMRKWLPLADAVLRMIVRCVPAPTEAQRKRFSTLVAPLPSLQGAELTAVRARVDRALDSIESCSTQAESDVVVFVSKMTPVRAAELSPQDLEMVNRKRAAASAAAAAAAEAEGSAPPPPLPSLDINDEVFIALARVFSGVLRRDSRLFVLGHHHNPFSLSLASGAAEGDAVDDNVVPSSSAALGPGQGGASSSLQRVPADSFGMYLFFGPSVRAVDHVPAGNLVGILGLDALILKTATLSSTWCCPPLRAITFQAQPMVRVAVEPVDHKDLAALGRGLQALFQFDPVVEVGLDEAGQHTMTCLGELHLEQCLKTLSERFAKCPVVASEPLVSFKETVLPCGEQGSSSSSSSHQARLLLPPPWCDLPNLHLASQGTIRLVCSGGSVALTIRCFALPTALAKLIDSSSSTGSSSSSSSSLSSSTSGGRVATRLGSTTRCCTKF